MRFVPLAAACIAALTACEGPSATTADPGPRAASGPTTGPATGPAPLLNGPPANQPGAVFGTCSDGTTLATLRGLVIKNLGTGQLMQDRESITAARRAIAYGSAQLGLRAVRTVSQDAALRLSHCRAQMTMVLPPEALERLAGNLFMTAAIGAGGWRGEGDGVTFVADVQYSAQVTDDDQDLFVELDGATPVIQGLGLLAVAAAVATEAQPGSVAVAEPPARAASE
jgi:hypothetical protein